MTTALRTSAVVSLPAVPNPAKLFESLRHSGYTNEAAIADLVDNSIDAEATQIRILIGPEEGRFTPETSNILIIDDGRGMTLDILTEAIRLGSEIDKDPASDLGKFGMGLITASISLSRRLTVLTKTKDGPLLRAVHDLDVIAERREFGADLYQDDDASRLLWETYTGNAEQGTIVELSNCDGIAWKNAQSFIRALHDHLGEVFRLFIIAKSKKNGTFQSFLWINKRPVYALDPLLLDERKDFTEVGQKKLITRFADVVDDFEIEVPIDRNRPELGSDNIKVRVVRLPDLNHTEKDAYGISIKSEGIYLIRNQRQIARAETLGLFVRHQNLIRFRAELQYPASLDKRMGLNWMKQHIDMDQSLKGIIENKLGPSWASIRRKYEREQATEQKIDHAPYQSLIASKAKLLTLPTQAKPLVLPPPTTKKKPETRTRHTQTTPPEETELRTLRERCLFKEGRMSPSGPLWDPIMEGRKMTITFNVEHPLWVRYVLEATEEERPQLLEMLHLFAFCLSASEFREFGDEEYVEKLINMRSQMAANMRVLLS